MAQEKKQLEEEYQGKIDQLQRDIEKEQESNAKAAAEMENLRQFYQDELQKMNSSSDVQVGGGDTQAILNKSKKPPKFINSTELNFFFFSFSFQTERYRRQFGGW